MAKRAGVSPDLYGSRQAEAAAILPATAAKTGASRLSWADYAKGIAIILVVVCHCAEGTLNAASSLPSPAWSVFLDISYAFMVPAFFVVAGWFSERTYQTKGGAYQLRYVLGRILYPYVVWTVAQTALMILSKAGNRVPSWADLPGFLLFGSMQFWFLRALVAAYCFQLVLRAVRFGELLGLGISAVALALFSLYPNAAPPSTIHPATHLFFFLAGAFCFRHRLRLSGRLALRLAAGLGLVSLFALHFMGARCDTPFRPITAMAGIVACLSLCALLPDSRWLLILKLVGRHSLPIYCLHVIFAAGTRAILFKAGVRSFDTQVLLGSIAGTIFPLGISIWSLGRFEWLFRFPRAGWNRRAPREDPRNGTQFKIPNP
jgi:fucose 4-O-acetylase-like acetyltransferase